MLRVSTSLPKVYLSCIGTFHHFDLARQLTSRGWPLRIFSSFPRWRLRREQIDDKYLVTIPWLQTLYMASGRLHLTESAKEGLSRLAVTLHDRTVAASLHTPGILVGLSNHNFHAGRRMQAIGGRWICDRGSTHARHQAIILAAEYRRLCLPIPPYLNRHVWQEVREYAACDLITVPTRFARATFIAQGVPGDKVAVLPYGVDLSRFKPMDEPPRDQLRLLFVGGVCVRKGVHDLLTAFAMLRNENRHLDIVGSVHPEFTAVLARHDLRRVTIHGAVPQSQLSRMYSRAHFLVLPSIEEGMALVQGQAMACGCPVISTPNAGAEDLYQDGIEGVIVPVRRPDIIAARITEAWLSGKCWQMRTQARERVQSIGGWEDYGRRFVEIAAQLTA